jgi:hypothetical protein
LRTISSPGLWSSEDSISFIESHTTGSLLWFVPLPQHGNHDRTLIGIKAREYPCHLTNPLIRHHRPALIGERPHALAVHVRPAIIREPLAHGLGERLLANASRVKAHRPEQGILAGLGRLREPVASPLPGVASRDNG